MADLKKETEKINIALKYTGGNMEKAKQMAAGHIKNLYTIKAKAELAGILVGFFIINVLQDENEVQDGYFFATRDRQAEHTRPFAPIPELMRSLVQIKENGAEEEGTSQQLYRAFNESIFTKLGQELIAAVQKKDLGGVNKLVNFIITSKLEFKKVNLQVEIEETSSFDFEYKDYGMGKVLPYTFNSATAAAPEPAAQKDFMESAEIKTFESKYSKVIDCDIVLSPVKGVQMKNLTAGQQIKVILPVTNPEQKDFAIVRGALNEDGEVRPVAASFRRIMPVDGGGYLLYADMKGKVLCRAFEESNVKVALADSSSPSVPTGKPRVQASVNKSDTEGSATTIIMIGIAAVLIIVMGVVLFFS